MMGVFFLLGIACMIQDYLGGKTWVWLCLSFFASGIEGSRCGEVFYRSDGR
jgi:hypothetical protein